MIAGAVVLVVLFGFNHVGQQLRSNLASVSQHIDLEQASPGRLTVTIIDAGN